jgi:DNA-binding MarR family transcriptional regulator
MKTIHSDGTPHAAGPLSTSATEAERAATVAFAHQLLALRRLREVTFGPSLFADPAWDLLLHLYVDTAAGRQVSVSSLCQSAQVRPTTGLRWINVLVDEELLVKSDDPEDARRVFIAFAPGAEQRMQKLLARAMTETSGRPGEHD